MTARHIPSLAIRHILRVATKLCIDWSHTLATRSTIRTMSIYTAHQLLPDTLKYGIGIHGLFTPSMSH